MSDQKLMSSRCSLDVITNGSDSTGAGSVLLTIYNHHKRSLLSEEKSNNRSILARYAFNVPELFTRICMDQAQKGISQLRAVFALSNSVECLAGLPGLCLRLNEYSLNETLTISGPVGISSDCEFLAREVLNRRQYPRIETCEVNYSASTSLWWQEVYDDDFLVVYARAYDLFSEEYRNRCDFPPLLEQCYGNYAKQNCICNTCSTNKSSKNSDFSKPFTSKFPCSKYIQVSYVCRVKELNLANESIRLPGFSFAIYPNGAVLSPLPEPMTSLPYGSGMSSVDDKPLHVALCVGGSEKDNVQGNKTLARLTYSMSTFANCCSTSWDHALLTKSTTITATLNKFAPFAFPMARNVRSYDVECQTSVDESILILKSGQSIIYKFFVTHLSEIDTGIELSNKVLAVSCDQNSSIPTDNSYIVHDNNCKIDRKQSSEKISDSFFEEKCHMFSQRVRDCYVSDFLPCNMTADNNEIDLESISSENNKSDIEIPSSSGLHANYIPKPYLLVIGTGCASPSVTRGSSSYGIFLPCRDELHSHDDCFFRKHMLSILFDTGEGCLTHLKRYAGGTSRSDTNILRDLYIIWISHGHLDHYAGIVTILASLLFYQRESSCLCDVKATTKRTKISDGFHVSRSYQKCNCKLVPIVIAPTKVLKFIDTFLHCKNGVLTGCIDHRIFFGINQRDFDHSPFADPIRSMIYYPKHNNSEYQVRSIRNIRVNHCHDAYGIVLGLYSIRSCSEEHIKVPDFYICFSGDTRPSRNVEEYCVSLDSSLSMLIHEATFDEIHMKDAIHKKHSTVKEALTMANSIRPLSCVLTHFSQRYPLIAPFYQKVRDNDINATIAIDGMLLPIDIGSNLKGLTFLVENVLSLISSKLNQ